MRTWMWSGVQTVVKKQSILDAAAAVAVAGGGDVMVMASPPALLPRTSWWALGGIAWQLGSNEAQDTAAGS